MIWNLIDMQCNGVKIVPANWRKLISDWFYRIRLLKLKNIVTKIVEIQVQRRYPPLIPILWLEQGRRNREKICRQNWKLFSENNLKDTNIHVQETYQNIF